MKAYIKAISYYLPTQVLTNEQLAAEFPEWTTEKIAVKVGIAERHIAAPEETASDMAVTAAERLFANGYDRSQIDFVLLCTQSPDYMLPSSACLVQHRLGLSTKCGAFDFNLGCSGYEYGLVVAKSPAQFSASISVSNTRTAVLRPFFITAHFSSSAPRSSAVHSAISSSLNFSAASISATLARILSPAASNSSGVTSNS